MSVICKYIIVSVVWPKRRKTYLISVFSNLNQTCTLGNRDTSTAILKILKSLPSFSRIINVFQKLKCLRFYQAEAASTVWSQNLSSRCTPRYCNDHFDITTLRSGSRIEAWQISKEKWTFLHSQSQSSTWPNERNLLSESWPSG